MAAHYEQRDTVLYVENLSIKFGDKLIISNINFEEKNITRPDVTQGQTIAFVGRSGRGKTTLFKALTGMEQPTTGNVLIPDFSKPITEGKQPAKKVEEGDVGYVNQKYTLFRHKTVYTTLLYALRKSAISREEKHEKIMQYLTEWGLESCKDQYPNEMSGGQRQRTAILEQLLSSGYYMVLDEPFSGLDIGNIMNVKESFRLVGTSHDLNTILFSTHDIELAVELADSLYVLGYPKKEDGKLASYGTILAHFDIKKMGLAWKEELSNDHHQLVKEIKSLMLQS